VNDKGLLTGSGIYVGDRVFIPVAEIVRIIHQRSAWIQVTPVAVVVVDGKEEYLLPMTEEMTLEELKAKVPQLGVEIQKWSRE
jgi:hypothetical protein